MYCVCNTMCVCVCVCVCVCEDRLSMCVFMHTIVYASVQEREVEAHMCCL